MLPSSILIGRRIRVPLGIRFELLRFAGRFHEAIDFRRRKQFGPKEDPAASNMIPNSPVGPDCFMRLCSPNGQSAP